MRIRILNNRRALDILHDEVRQIAGGRTAVQQPRDVRMIEIGENLTLVTKTLHHEISVHAALDEFYRHPFSELLVGALGEIDRAHAAASDLADDFVKADAIANHRSTIGRGNSER